MKALLTGIVLAVGLATAACGDAGDSGLPTFEHAVKGDRVDPESFLDALRGSFSTGSTAAISLDVQGGASLRGRGTVRYTAKSMDVSLRVDDWKIPDASIDIRTVDGTTYMRVPESRGLWVDLAAAGPGVPGADLAEEADPRRSIDDLRDTITEVRFGGTETLGGTRTRRFQVVTVPKTEPGSGSAAAGTTGTAKPVVTQYWFDRRDRIVRRESDLAPVGRATFVWTKWGSPVTIVPPKAGTVITLKELERLRREQAGTAAP